MFKDLIYHFKLNNSLAIKAVSRKSITEYRILNVYNI